MGVTLPQRCIKVIWVLGLFYGLSDSIGSSHQTSQLSAYEVTVPRRIGKQRRDLDGATSGTVSYVIHVQAKDHVVILEKNELLLPDDFTVYSYGKDGSLITERPRVQDHCHYQGYVEDMDGSSVALSICAGLRGVLHMDNGSFGIEPLESSTGFEHLVYRLEDVRTEPLKCGTPHSETDHTHDPRAVPVSHLLRRKRAVLHQTHYVELLLVVDNDRFNYMSRNQRAVREEMIQLANYVDSMYVALNIRIVLVGLEIWSQGNPINTDGSAGEVLGRFVQWREQNLVHRRRHDSAQLILKKSFGTTAGMAFVGTVCSRSQGGGINAYTNTNVQSFASIVAHELGHNLGMTHDDGPDRQNCLCTASSCIMSSGATGSRNFSSCSADDFEKFILLSGGSCLLNIPRPDEAYSAPFCGNRLVDVGEECDCGSDKECEKDPCCEAKTCKLKSWAQCADGVCCKNCQFLPGGAECRSSVDECDLPEFCNGSSPDCQSDVFKQDGHPCKDSQAYCYNGKCRDYHKQCQALFGEKARAAPELCFKDVNSVGDRFGNCGFQGHGFKKCEKRNAMCGKLQCENLQGVKVFGLWPSTINIHIAGTTCRGVDFRLGSDVPDPGMVNDGTRCEENKVCLNYQCVNVDVLKYDCNVQEKCHGHGVHVEGQEVKESTCSCAIGRAKCHHVAALLIWAEKNLTRTDVECVWKRATTPKTDEVTAKRVSVIAPSTSQAGVKRPVTQEDREWALQSLAQLDRFTGLGWILAPETPQTVPIKTVDGVVTSPGYGNAEDKALYVLSSLAVSPQEKEAIERATVGQTKNALWTAYRKKRVTASNFGLVLRAVKRNSYPPSLFKTLLGQYNLKQGAYACDWGILHEPKAKQEYTERTGVTIQERGVFLSDSGLLGGSPDGMVSDDCIIEIKCPYAARTKTNLQAAEGKDFCLELDEVTGLLKLKQTHNHWHQIQGNLHLTGANSCHLVVWTPLDLAILLIHKDPAWVNNINVLETFYKDCFLPHILSQM